MADWPDWNLIAAAIFALFTLYFLSRLLYKPLKLCLKVLLCTLLGGIVIFLYNFAGVLWGLKIGLNVISALVVGVMGLPGLGMLVALKYIFS